MIVRAFGIVSSLGIVGVRSKMDSTHTIVDKTTIEQLEALADEVVVAVQI
jgi:hypothetical protein